MSWTKGDLVNEAFSEIGIASYEFDTSPEERIAAIRRLDMMMAEWNGRGLRLGYPLPDGPDCSSTDDDSGIPDWAVEPVVLNLAIRMAPSYGKTLPPDTKAVARRGLTTLYNMSTVPVEMQFQQMPKGAGYKETERRFTRYPKDKLAVGEDGFWDFGGALNVDTNK